MPREERILTFDSIAVGFRSAGGHPMPGPNRDTMSAHRKTMLRRLAANRRLDNRERAEEAALALELMNAGTYGFCLLYGLRIPELRLQTKPETTRCERCEAEVRRATGA